MADSVWTVIQGSADLITFASAVGAVPALAEHLDSANVATVLALSDDAFSALPQSLIRELLSDPDRHAAFVRHQVSRTASLDTTAELPMLDGRTVAVGGSAEAPTFGGVPARPRPLIASNGTVFVLDALPAPS